MYKIAVPEMIIDEKDLPDEILAKCELIIGAKNEVGDNRQFIDHINELDAIVFTSINDMSKGVMEKAENLKIAFKAGAWPHNIDFNYAENNGIAVGWSPAANARSVAEYTLLLILAANKKFSHAIKTLELGGWRNESHLGEDIKGKRIGIVGLGAIGKEVSVFLKALSVDVIGYDPFLDEEGFDNIGVKKVSFDKLIQTSDVITIHSPLTKDTNKMFNKEVFTKMKNDSIIINTARGGLIDEEELIKSLKTQEIKGAALDVFAEEPLPLSSELRKLNNVILTPHIAARTTQSSIKEILWAIQGAFNYLEGKKIDNAKIVYPNKNKQ